MTQLSRASFVSKWNGRFADNITREIEEEDLREFVEDVKDSFFNITDYTAPAATFEGLTGSPMGNTQLVNWGNGLLNSLKGGVSVNYNTLKKLYDFVVGGDFKDYNGHAYLYRFGGTSITVSGTNTYTFTFSTGLGPGSYSSALRYFVNFPNANTGPSTLNLDSMGPKDIKRRGGAAVQAGDLSGIVILAYNGTYFQILGNDNGINGGTP